MYENKEILDFPQCFSYSPYQIKDFTCKIECEVSLKVCKVIILGDLCVGKTTLLNRFSHKVFDSSYKSTIGVDFHSEQINIKGFPYHLQIWDTAGQERFKSITQCYYRNAHAVMLVFDLSSIRTLVNCKTWLKEVLHIYSNNTNNRLPFLFLIGTKKDLLSNQAYLNTEELAVAEARNLKAEFWSVSSKTGENVDELFFRAAALNFDLDLREACFNFTRNIPIVGPICRFKEEIEEDRKKENVLQLRYLTSNNK